MLEHKVVPPNININNANPSIMWEKYRLKVPTDAMLLNCRSSTKRPLISLSGSGIGGSNGHMVVEGPPSLPPPATLLSSKKSVLFIVGGLSPRATQEISSSILDMLKRDSSKEALSQAVTHSRRARQLPWRTYFVYTPSLVSAVRMENPVLVPRKRPPIVFVFTGQGPQHINMGRDLFATFDVFRESVLEMDKIYEDFTGVSFIKTTGLFDGDNTTMLPPVWSVEITSPAMTIIEIALFDLLVSVGIKPDFLVGHSMGETPLLYASGACSKAMAVEVAIVRGKAMSVTETGAGMAAISCGAGRSAVLIEQVKSELDGVLEIACLNSPDATVLSGSEDLVEKAVSLAQQDEIFAHKLKSITPGHTSLMENCRLEYQSGLNDIFSRYEGSHKPILRTYTSVGGHNGNLIDEFTPDYLWNNVRKHVAFHQAIVSLLQDSPSSVFVEISPHPALSPYVSAASPSSVVTCPMRRLSKKTTTESIAFAESLGVLSTNGVNSIDLTPIYGRASRDPAFDIQYPFIARHFPLRIEGPRELMSFGGGPCFERLKMNAKTHPDLAEHIINGEPIVPAAAFIDMVHTLPYPCIFCVLSGHLQILQTGAKILWDLEFRSILSLASETPTEVRIEHEGSHWSIKTAYSNSHANKVSSSCLGTY
jgi:acyl transferase domain-containing protein